MADSPRYPGSGPDTGNEGGAGRRSTTDIRRWVKVFGIIVAVLALLIVAVMLLLGGGDGGHGPGRHAQSGDVAGQPPLASAHEERTAR